MKQDDNPPGYNWKYIFWVPLMFNMILDILKKKSDKSWKSWFCLGFPYRCSCYIFLFTSFLMFCNLFLPAILGLHLRLVWARFKFIDKHFPKINNLHYLKIWRKKEKVILFICFQFSVLYSFNFIFLIIHLLIRIYECVLAM